MSFWGGSKEPEVSPKMPMNHDDHSGHDHSGHGHSSSSSSGYKFGMSSIEQLDNDLTDLIKGMSTLMAGDVSKKTVRHSLSAIRNNLDAYQPMLIKALPGKMDKQAKNHIATIRKYLTEFQTAVDNGQMEKGQKLYEAVMTEWKALSKLATKYG